MSEDVEELKKLKADLKVTATKIAFEADLNPQTVYAVLRGEAGQNSVERVRKTLRRLEASKQKTKTAS